MKKKTHPLHKALGEYILNCKYPECKIILSPECIPNIQSKNILNQNIPFFIGSVNDKSNATELCNVDLVILKNDEIKVIIEIEESDRTPVRTAGKFLISVLSDYYADKGGKAFNMSNKLLFIQILKSYKNPRSSKETQGKNLKEQIRSFIQNCDKQIQYELCYCQEDDFKNNSYNKCKEIKNIIEKFLSNTDSNKFVV